MDVNAGIMEGAEGNEARMDNLSKRMFWDTPLSSIHWYDHRHFIVERVMRYGRFSDWQIIFAWYGREELRNLVVRLRDLDARSIAYLALMLDLSKEDFRCYTANPSQRNFWDC